jgi:hypothetical protein
MVVNATMLEDVAYALCETVEARKALMPTDNFKPLDMAQLCANDQEAPYDVPLHRGAKRFYLEKVDTATVSTHSVPIRELDQRPMTATAFAETMCTNSESDSSLRLFLYSAFDKVSSAFLRDSAHLLSVVALILPSGVLMPTPSVLMSNRIVSRSETTFWY